MIVTDLGSLGIPVAYTAEGVALAVPAEAAAEGGAGTIFAAPEDIPAADEGSWDVADGRSRTMVSVSFLVLGTDSLEGAPSHLDDELVSPAELICFVQDSFIMPVARRLLEAWERHVPSEVQMEGGVTPREEGGWQFEDARERPPRARGPASSSEALGSCKGTWRPRQRGCAAAGQASNASSEHRGDSTAPRRAVRRDREEDDGLGTFYTSIRCRWISGRRHCDTQRSAWRTAKRRSVAGWRDPRRAGSGCGPTRGRLPVHGGAGSSRPAARAATSARAAIADRNHPFWGGSSAGTARRSSGEPFRTRIESRRVIRAGAAGSAEDYEAAAGSLLSGGVDARVAGASGILGLERIVAIRRAHPEVVAAANDRVTREALGLLPGESLSVQRHARELLIPETFPL